MVFLIAACNSPQSRRDSFFSKAKKSYASAQYDDAVVEVKNVLRIDPRFGPAYVLMGDIALKQNVVKKALQHFLKGYKLDPASHDANMGLATCYLQDNNFERARQHLDVARNDFPDDFQVQYLNAQLLLKEGAYTESLEIAQRLLVTERSRDVYFLIAHNYLGLKKNDFAIKILLEGIEVLSNDPLVHYALGSVYEAHGSIDLAENEYKKTVSLSGDDFYSYFLVNFYIKNNNIKEAKSILNEIIISKHEYKAIIFLADILNKEEHVNEARDLLLRHVAVDKENFELKYFLANFYISHNELSPAINVLEELLVDDPRVIQRCMYLKKNASVYSLLNNKEKVDELMQRVLKEDPNDPDALMFSAHAILKDGSLNNAVLKFRQVIHFEPTKDRAFLALANAYLIKGDRPMAVQILAESIAKNDSIRAHLLLIQIFEEDMRYDRAIEHLEILNKKSPGDMNIAKHLAILYIKEQRVNDAEKCLQSCACSASNSVAPKLALSDFYRSQGMFGRAHFILDEILSTTPQLEHALEEKIRIFYSEKKKKEGFTFIEQKVHDPSVKDYLKAELRMMDKDYEKAESFYLRSLRHNTNNFHAANRLIAMYATQKKYDQGISLCKKMRLQNPSDFRTLFLLGYLYQCNAQYEKAVSLYEQALKESPTFFPAANNIAYLYAEKFPSKANLEHALDLMLHFSHSVSPDGLDTLAWIYTKKGDFQKSIPILEKLASRPGSDPLIFYHLGFAYMKNGDFSSAKIWLTKSIESQKYFSEIETAKEMLKSISS